jgi:hypothetical protein
VTDESYDLALKYKRLLVNRALLIAAHLILASIVAVAYLSRLNFPWLPFSGGVGGSGLVGALAPPLLPYLVSGIRSRSLVTPSRSRVASFIIFLTITTALVISLLLGHFGPLGWMGLVVMFGVQAVAYVWSAGILLGARDAL